MVCIIAFVSVASASFTIDSIQVKNVSAYEFWAMKKANEKAIIKSYDSIPYQDFKPTIKGKLQLSFN